MAAVEAVCGRKLSKRGGKPDNLVCCSFASGAAFYFALPLELSAWVIVGYLEAVLLLLWLTRRRDGQFKLLTYAAVFCSG